MGKRFDRSRVEIQLRMAARRQLYFTQVKRTGTLLDNWGCIAIRMNFAFKPGRFPDMERKQENRANYRV
jgi:hypothetical protein